MTQEDKQLLLKDLCARLPYKPLLESPNEEVYKYLVLNISDIRMMMYPEYGEEDIILRPYLRPMSSMTEEEKEVYINTFLAMWDAVDWLNARHFDYRGLIEKGLALEAPEGMYRTE